MMHAQSQPMPQPIPRAQTQPPTFNINDVITVTARLAQILAEEVELALEHSVARHVWVRR